MSRSLELCLQLWQTQYMYSTLGRMLFLSWPMEPTSALSVCVLRITGTSVTAPFEQFSQFIYSEERCGFWNARWDLFDREDVTLHVIQFYVKRCFFLFFFLCKELQPEAHNCNSSQDLFSLCVSVAETWDHRQKKQKLFNSIFFCLIIYLKEFLSIVSDSNLSFRLWTKEKICRQLTHLFSASASYFQF